MNGVDSEGCSKKVTRELRSERGTKASGYWGKEYSEQREPQTAKCLVLRALWTIYKDTALHSLTV